MTHDLIKVSVGSYKKMIVPHIYIIISIELIFNLTLVRYYTPVDMHY